MKKKVAIIIPSLRGGGAERVIVNILNQLDIKKFELRLIIIKKEGAYLNQLPKNLKVIDLNSKRVRTSIIKLVSQINKFKPDIILSTLHYLNFVILLIRFSFKGKPKIIVREGNTPSMNMSKLSIGKRLLFTYLYKRLYPKADQIVAQCKDMKEDIIREFGISESKITHIYNPINIRRIKIDSTKFNPYVKENNVNIVAIGRLVYQKGFDILINAFKLVKDKKPNIHLTILGEGPLKNELNTLIEKLGLSNNVSLIGFQDNPYPYLHFADLYVLSSRWEGFPNTLLEALACEIMAVATDCKSGPREILGNNKYGTLVTPEDPDALALGIIKSLNSNKKVENRAERYDIIHIIKDYENLLLKI